jgi:hypothetical protein
MRAGARWATPRAFTIAVGATAVVCAVHLVVLAFRSPWRARPAAPALSAAFSAGILLVAGAGLANWLQRIQGFVVAPEQETTPLVAEGGRLQDLDFGPLAHQDELGVTLVVDRVELEPVEPGGFRPVTRLRARAPGRDAVQLAIRHGAGGEVGALRLYQGAFGFAPRIVILKDGRTVFDRSVPFRTKPDPTGLLFQGSFELAAEQLAVEGVVTLENLDERMKGHPRLALSVKRDGRALGGGELEPGHFAELAEGYRLGFAGMKRWTEIDVSRHSYALPIWIGLALVAAAVVGWPVAAWRRW